MATTQSKSTKFGPRTVHVKFGEFGLHAAAKFTKFGLCTVKFGPHTVDVKFGLRVASVKFSQVAAIKSA